MCIKMGRENTKLVYRPFDSEGGCHRHSEMSVGEYELLQSSIDYSTPLPSVFEVVTSSTLSDSIFDYTLLQVRSVLSALRDALPVVPVAEQSALGRTIAAAKSFLDRASTTNLPEAHFLLLYTANRFMVKSLPGDAVTAIERLCSFRR